ncbi:siderophore-iron reductase FhuF [Rhizobium sp. SSA_523]|uniref:siderophore-iron reductase FhuF n=1 Tax=Rhizobium sp. SSA_523 TaxID=2952477 RepID=UPI002090630E|nr:siderophore-iron reductase FhuF [Rhizobium sp. SSA_523]MCO5731248.1 siderophore-iron reductase FhuF [Rhizobium sp. SSA_523]WKC22214.1 siderophore-iron reductase FhuF [Rhizobium sp. SSA_523]
MIEEFRQLFAEPLVETGDRLCLFDGRPAVIAGPVLAEPDYLHQVLARFAGNYAEPEQRAVASQWSKQYFSHLLMPVLAINLVLSRALPVRLEAMGVTLAADGRPQQFFLEHAGTPVPVSEHFSDRFDEIFDGHVLPLVASLSKVSGLPQKVLWANVGNITENVIGFCAGMIGETQSISHGRDMLASRLWPDGRRNMLYEPVRYTVKDGRSVRKRKVCCLRYLIPSLKLCGTCPLDEVPAKEADRPLSRIGP